MPEPASAAAPLLAALLLLLLCGSPALAEISHCGSEAGRCVQAAVDHCERDAPHCVLRRGSKATITIRFIPEHRVSAVKPRVFGELYGVKIPFPLDQDNACGFCGFDCPLEAGQEYTYTDSVPVKKMYPKVDVNVYWKLMTGEGKVICCVKIPSKIK